MTSSVIMAEHFIESEHSWTFRTSKPETLEDIYRHKTICLTRAMLGYMVMLKYMTMRVSMKMLV